MLGVYGALGYKLILDFQRAIGLLRAANDFEFRVCLKALNQRFQPEVCRSEEGPGVMQIKLQEVLRFCFVLVVQHSKKLKVAA